MNQVRNFQRNTEFAQDGVQASYKQSEKLIHQMARKVHNRVVMAHLAFDFDDIVQELNVIWVKAVEAFDPSMGNTFSTYFVRSGYRHINKLVEKQANYQIGLGIASLDERVNDNGDSSATHLELVPSNDLTPEMELIRDEAIQSIIGSLSPQAQKVIEWTLNPPKMLLNEVEKRQAKAELSKSMGVNARVRGFSIADTLDVFAMCFGISKPERVKIRRELSSVEHLL